MRALCVPQGAPEPLQKELGPLGTRTWRTVRDKLDTLGGLLPFFFLLKLHPIGRVKTPARGATGNRKPLQRGGHI